MSANAVTSPKDWSVETDEEGHADYTLTWGVSTTAVTDGPDVALSAAGLPTPGASLGSLGGNSWAFFNRKGGAKLKKVDALRKYWDVTTVFTTRPARRCTTSAIEDPLLEPHRVKGNFQQTIQELLYDVNGAALVNSSNQRYTGAIVQDTTSTPIVEVEMNCSFIDLTWLANYADSYNNTSWWGMPARSLKCTTGPWERVLYGTCYFYFIVRFTFELKLPTWDIIVPDEGTRVKVTGSSPARHVLATDEYENVKGMVFLNGAGVELPDGDAIQTRTFQRPKQKDFSAAGWPASLL